MIPAARRWSSSDGDPPRPDERGVMRIERRGRVEDDEGEERVLGHLGEQVADPRRVAHPPRRRIERDRRPPEQQRPGQEQGCSMSWISGSSSDALNSGEKWTAHIIAANIIQAVTGCAMNRTTREWRTGRSQRCLACLRRAQPQDQGDRCAQREQAGPPPASTARAGPCGPRRATCRSDSIPETSAKASAVIPARKATVRRRGTGFPGCAALTRRTAHSHQPTATAMPRVGSGSNDQPSSSMSRASGARRGRSVRGGRGRRRQRPPATSPTSRATDDHDACHRRHGRTNRPRSSPSSDRLVVARSPRSPDRMVAVSALGRPAPALSSVVSPPQRARDHPRGR